MCIMIGACLPAASHTHNELVFSTGDGLLVQFGVSSSQGGGSSSGFDTGERGHWEFLTEVRSVGKTRPRCGVITDCMDTY